MCMEKVTRQTKADWIVSLQQYRRFESLTPPFDPDEIDRICGYKATKVPPCEICGEERESLVNFETINMDADDLKICRECLQAGINLLDAK